MDEVKYIDIKDFRKQGYLLEVNRQFLHPLGLALEVSINEEGEEYISGIWDYRQDPEGIVYGERTVNSESSLVKSKRIEKERREKELVRQKKYGFGIQPISYNEEENE